MLADNLENWAKRAQEEGEKRGEAKGRMTTLESTLRSQVKLKFGEVPAWADQRIRQANDNELNHWLEQILFADSLDALFSD